MFLWESFAKKAVPFSAFFFCFFWFRTGCEECREMLQEASWESKDFQGTPVIRFISYHFLMVWWDPSNSSFHEFFTQTWGAWDLLRRVLSFRNMPPDAKSQPFWSDLEKGRPFGCNFNVKVPDCKGEFERKTVFPLAFFLCNLLDQLGFLLWDI